MSKQRLLFEDDKKVSTETEEWVQRLWNWADQYKISNKYIPRDRDKLFKMRKLDLMMVYFGLNKIPKEKMPKGEVSSWSEKEKKSFLLTSFFICFIRVFVDERT